MKKLGEEGRVLLGLSVGWDHDANRGSVATPTTLSALQTTTGFKKYKVLIHPKIALEGQGKGLHGEKTASMHNEMIRVSKLIANKYQRGRRLLYGTHGIFDDDDGSYVNKFYIALKDNFSYDNIQALPNKKGKIIDTSEGFIKLSKGFGVEARDEMWQNHVNNGNILIDKANTELCFWLKHVPLKSPEICRREDKRGKWGTRLKDISNSAEYGWWPWRAFFLNPLLW